MPARLAFARLRWFLLCVCSASAACAYPSARRVPGSDIALPQKQTDLVRTLLTIPCAVTRVPETHADSTRTGACAVSSKDTAQTEPGMIGRAPRTTP